MSKENPALKTDMTVIPPRESGARSLKIRSWVLRVTLALAILGPLVFIVAGLGSKFGLWDWRFGLGTLTRKVGPLVLGASALLGLLSLLLAFVIRPRKGILIALAAIIVPVFAIMQVKSVQKTAQTLPFIHDVTTDTQDVPQFTNAIMSERAALDGVNTADYIGKMAPITDESGKPGQELVSVLQTQAYPNIRPIILPESKDVVFGKVEAVVSQMGWAMKSSDLETGIIEATDTTFWYGFKDDVIIRLRESEGGGTLVDVRSLSRVGGSDLGKNADRIRDFFKGPERCLSGTFFSDEIALA